MLTLTKRQLEVAMVGLIAYQANFEETQNFMRGAIAAMPEKAPVIPTAEELRALGDLLVATLDGE